jgi:hypothetical protein
MVTRDEMQTLRKAALAVLEALKSLWVDCTREMIGRGRRTVGHDLESVGQIAAQLEPILSRYDEHFALFGRVSRQPYGTITFTASSTTEYAIRHGILIAQAIDGSMAGNRTLRKVEGLTNEEREVYRKSWHALRVPLSNSGMLPTYAKCTELAAEVDWEFHRAVGLLPPEQKRPMACEGTIEVFVSYSHADEKLQKKLTNHLSQLKNEGLIRDWHDRKIGAGTDWDGQINEHLSSAHVILLLVSSDFLASPYIHDVEVRRAIERHDAGAARVIPVILRSCDWHSAPFGKLQALPTNGKAVTLWSNRDQAFTVIARGIRVAVTEIINAAGGRG